MILDRTKDLIKPGELLYIATDESDKTFFQPFRDAGHRIVFLDDFCDSKCIGALDNPNLIGMIEQAVIAQGRVFIGTWYSTFTGYSQRIRGYLGLANESYYSLPEHKYAMQDNSLNVSGELDHLNKYCSTYFNIIAISTAKETVIFNFFSGFARGRLVARMASCMGWD